MRWRDMRSRTKGKATRHPEIYSGLDLGWGCYDEFRAWALQHGFSKTNNSPHRLDNHKGYVPDNVKFLPPFENTFEPLRKVNEAHAKQHAKQNDDDSDVPF